MLYFGGKSKDPEGRSADYWESAPQEFAKAKIRYRRAPGRSIEANIGEYATKSNGQGRG